VALGAERVIAAGRNTEALAALVTHSQTRIVPVALSVEVDRDVSALKAASGGGAQVSFDMVGGATDANATVLKSLRRGGRLVLMGSMSAPLPLAYGDIVANNWEVIGNFVDDAAAYRRLVSLVRAGLLNLDVARIQAFPFVELKPAMEAARRMQGLDCTVVQIGAAGR
jgi:alcohol dehydrogenase